MSQAQFTDAAEDDEARGESFTSTATPTAGLGLGNWDCPVV